MVYGDYAGMHLLAELNTQMRAEWIVKEAGKRGVRVYALEEYMVPGARGFLEGKPTLLLGYGALCEKDMKEGIAVLREILMPH